jgi:ribosomal protein L11 methyltransferase
LPYRIDLSSPPPDAFDLLVELGALDIEPLGDGLAAILPDSVTRDMVAAHFGSANVTVSAAVARDDGSVWMLSPRAVRAGGFLITPAGAAELPDALRLTDSDAFGTGHHVTTALCLEVLEEIVRVERPDSILDVGTGSGILALAALKMGVPRAVGLDIDAGALKAAAENARLNQLSDRIELLPGGPDVVKGIWPLVVANVLAAPLIEMAPVLVQRLGKRGQLILSGIHSSLESEVRRAYRHFGIHLIESKTRAGWTVLTAQAPW